MINLVFLTAMVVSPEIKQDPTALFNTALEQTNEQLRREGVQWKVSLRNQLPMQIPQGQTIDPMRHLLLQIESEQYQEPIDIFYLMDEFSPEYLEGKAKNLKSLDQLTQELLTKVREHLAFRETAAKVHTYAMGPNGSKFDCSKTTAKVTFDEQDYTRINGYRLVARQQKEGKIFYLPIICSLNSTIGPQLRSYEVLRLNHPNETILSFMDKVDPRFETQGIEGMFLNLAHPITLKPEQIADENDKDKAQLRSEASSYDGKYLVIYRTLKSAQEAVKTF